MWVADMIFVKIITQPYILEENIADQILKVTKS